MDMQFLRRICLLVLVPVLSLSLVGCGAGKDPWVKRRPKTVRTTGEVFYKGAPVSGALVTFANQEAGRSASAKTDKNGRFVLRTFVKNDGAVPGLHMISVYKVVPEFPGTPLVGLTQDEFHSRFSAMSDEERGKLGEGVMRWLIPERYGSLETSGLTAEVVDGNENHFQLELQD